MNLNETLQQLADRINEQREKIDFLSKLETVNLKSDTIHIGDITNTTTIFLRDREAVTDAGDGWLRLNDDGDYIHGVFVTGSINLVGTAITMNGRVAVTDNSDGWLRLNNSSNYANGVYTPSNIRIDGNVLLKSDRLALSDTNDTYLRLNNSNHYTGGVYTPNRVWFDSTLNLGVSTVNANVRLRIVSTGNNNSHYPILVNDNTDTNALFYVRSATVSTATGFLANTTWLYSSDEALKEDITDIPSQKDNLKLLKPKRFKYKGEDKYSLGFTAQDIQQVYPELVEEVEHNGSTSLAIRTGDIIPLLVKEIIELREKVDTLENSKADKPEKK